MNKYLSLCVEIEETIALVYRQLASSRNIPSELKTILNDLAHDEDEHAMQLNFAKRFTSGAAFVEKNINRLPAEELLARAKHLYEEACQQHRTIKETIEMGIELEKDFCETHIANSVEFKDETLKKMFAALAQDDKTHKQKLINAKVTYLPE